MFLKGRQRLHAASGEQTQQGLTLGSGFGVDDKHIRTSHRRNAHNISFFFFACLLAVSPFFAVHLILREPSSTISATAQADKDVLLDDHEMPSTTFKKILQAGDPLRKGGENHLLHVARPEAAVADPAELRMWANKINGEMHIRNRDLFPLETPEVVIAIQIHSRLPELRALLQSLRAVQGIEKALIVLSHDHFADEIIAEVDEVDFCQVLQLFFPYSNQLHPDTFPGTDPRDCARDTVQKNGCTGEPDQYGHYRETKFTATKHHWWWKLNFLFSKLPQLSLNGRVLLLEEDHLVAPDLLAVLHAAEAVRELSAGKEVNMVVLGAYFKPGRAMQLSEVPAMFAEWGQSASKATIIDFSSVRSNMGMVIDHRLYKQLTGCTDEFCTWPDYNWDWSFQALQLKCNTLGGPIRVLQLDAARVFHAGDCNGMHQNVGCKNSAMVDQIESQLARNAAKMFPEEITISQRNMPIRGPSQYANGGWGDPRDQQLCRHFAGMADLPPGVTRMQPSERQQGEAQLAENDVKTTDMHAAAVRLPAKKKAAKHRNLPFSEQMAPNPGILSSLMNSVGAGHLSSSHGSSASPAKDSNHHSGKSHSHGQGPTGTMYNDESPAVGQDIGTGLSIDPWARGNSTADKELASKIRQLLTQEETHELKALCGRCLYHTITTAVALRGLGEDAHVSTGDIPDMWLRDSAFEIAVYMPRMVARPAFRLAVEGTIRRHAFDITMDPYACGFSWKWWDPNTEVNEFNRRQGRGGWVAIRSFEIDSGAYFMNLLWDYFKTPGLYRPEALIRETLIHDAVSHMVNTYITEQHHETSPYVAHDLPNNGKGTPVGYTGMVWSGYRASDDATALGYNIPDNMFLAGALERMITLNAAVWNDGNLGQRMQKLLTDIQGGLNKHATVERDGQTVYAYEVDGLGKQLVDFDDPNIPSLMSVPLLGYSGYNKGIYKATRDRLFQHNRFYLKGSKFEGWASPHTPSGQVWHLGWITQGLTTEDPNERVRMLRNLLAAQCGNGLMHETVNINMESHCTRKWFEWANAMFVVLMEDSLGETCDEVADAEFSAKIQAREQKEKKHFSSALFYENMEQHIHHADRWDSTKLMDNIVRR